MGENLEAHPGVEPDPADVGGRLKRNGVALLDAEPPASPHQELTWLHSGPAAAVAAIGQLAAEAVLDKLTRGVVIVDRTARVLFVNPAAIAVIERGDALRLTVDGRVVIVDRETQRRFVSHIERVVPMSSGSMTFRIERAAEAGAYRVLVTVLTSQRLCGLVNGSGPLHAIFVYEPHGRRNVPLRILRELYGLTSAEADLAASLFEGLSLREAAMKTRVSFNTVRSHLKHIFAKCDVNSQAELMQLLALGPRTM